MGSQSVCITRDEFVTPPEFRAIASAAHPAARVGGARLELFRSGAETRMGTCYQQIPLRVMPPFSFATGPEALLYLINLTAGLMDGDAHLIQVKAGAGTRAVVTGQSATRVHPAVASFATQQWDVEVDDDACLVVLPGPTIPYAGCRYYQRGRVKLAPRARLIWGDIWLPGRYDRGALSERFQFERMIQDFAAYRAGKLVYRERFRWEGPWSPDKVQWYFGGHLASASLFVGGPLPERLPSISEGTKRAVFRLDTGESCIRWCGHPGVVTADLVLTAMSLAACWATGEGSAPWLIHSTELAPSHWFSPPVGRLDEKPGELRAIVTKPGDGIETQPALNGYQSPVRI